MNLSEATNSGTPHAETFATGAGPTAVRIHQASGRQDFRPQMNDATTRRVPGSVSDPVRTARGISRRLAAPSRPPSAPPAKEPMVEGVAARADDDHTQSSTILFVVLILAILAVVTYFKLRQAEPQAEADVAVVREAGPTAWEGPSEIFN